MKTWDYYANTYQRYSIDNKHYRMLARVHYGASNYANAFWNGKSLAFGDNGGNAFVSMDLVGHEYTHGVFEKALGVDAQHPLIYAGEVGAFNESFADIFGTAVEFYVREHQCIPCQPDGAPYRTCQQQGGSYCLAGNYFLGEDIYNGSNAQT